MRFSTIFAAAAIAFSFVAAQATPAQQIVQAFKEITSMSNDLRVTTEKLGLVTILTQGYMVPQGFGQIGVRVGKATTMLSGPGMTTLSEPDSTSVVGALTTFVQVHQALLNVVIGKHGLLSAFLVAEPVREALVSLEQVVDAFAFALIALISSTQKSAANSQFGALSVTLTQAKDTYSPGLPIPL